MAGVFVCADGPRRGRNRPRAALLIVLVRMWPGTQMPAHGHGNRQISAPPHLIDIIPHAPSFTCPLLCCTMAHIVRRANQPYFRLRFLSLCQFLFPEPFFDLFFLSFQIFFFLTSPSGNTHQGPPKGREKHRHRYGEWGRKRRNNDPDRQMREHEGKWWSNEVSPMRRGNEGMRDQPYRNCNFSLAIGGRLCMIVGVGCSW